MTVDLQSFEINHLGTINVNIPQVEVSARVVRSGTQEELGDFTATKRLVWPNVMTTMTADERREVMQTIIEKVLEIKLRAFQS